jgi:hypothetical protein
MKNLKITEHFRGAMYSNITKERLNEVLSSGYNRLLKNKCKNAYTMFDFKQGILEANHLAVKDEHRHTADLMLFALAHIEDLEKTICELEEIIKEMETKEQETINENKEE